MSNYKYKSGFFGGKFIPLHLGHSLCISVALALCETVHVILFLNGDDELLIQSTNHKLPKEYLNAEYRIKQLKELIKNNPRIKLHVIDTRTLKLPNGKEDWDAETPLVIEACGEFQAVFSSEPSYDAYFKRAYPWAEHIIVDAKREKYPISSTMIRNMSKEEAESWIIKPSKTKTFLFCQFDKKGNLIRKRDSIKDCAYFLSYQGLGKEHTITTNLSACLLKKTKSCCGYYFDYESYIDLEEKTHENAKAVLAFPITGHKGAYKIDTSKDPIRFRYVKETEGYVMPNGKTAYATIVSKCCKGKRDTHAGYKWMYEAEYALRNAREAE